MGIKTVYKKSMGPKIYNNLCVHMCWPSFTWNEKLPHAWGDEDTTVWELDVPTKLSFTSNRDIEWKFQFFILGFGLVVFRQYSY